MKYRLYSTYFDDFLNIALIKKNMRYKQRTFNFSLVPTPSKKDIICDSLIGARYLKQLWIYHHGKLYGTLHIRTNNK